MPVHVSAMKTPTQMILRSPRQERTAHALRPRRPPSSKTPFLPCTEPAPATRAPSGARRAPANTTGATAVRHIRRRQPHAAHTSNSCFLLACTPAVGKAQQAYPRAPNFNVERRPKSRDKTILHLQQNIFRSVDGIIEATAHNAVPRAPSQCCH